MNIREGIESMMQSLELLQSPSPTTTTHRVTWRGQVYPCIISTERRGEHLEMGGFVSQVQLTIYIRKSLFGTIEDASVTDITADSDQVTVDSDQTDPRPTKEIELTTRSRKYRIAEVGLDPSEAFYTLTCVDDYKP